MPSASVRVRFAPSPTGHLHIGSARTALFNQLFAKNNEGHFFLRIEDTDALRSDEKYLAEILDSLRWLGITWDGEPTYQSKQHDLYRGYAETLCDRHFAYRDGDAIILTVDDAGEVSFFDLVREKITVKKSEIKDQVLIKSDGTPTYNFACVIDDADMAITHVIRGEDHISNTPKQLLLYQALGLEPPQFAHIPLILSKDGGRMSKRHGATSISEYRAMGYLPEALVNFLSLLGWSPGDDRQILSREETVRDFCLENVHRAGAVFDIDKLNWMNGQYIMKLSREELVARIAGFLKEKNVVSEAVDIKKLAEVVAMYRERAKTLSDFESVYRIFFGGTFEYIEKAVTKHLKDTDRAIFQEWHTKLQSVDPFDKGNIEQALRGMADEKGIKPAKLIHPTRVAISGTDIGAGLFEMMEILGKDTVLKRIRSSIETFVQQRI
ncbi:MAG: glutamate--tRNA ligase [Candidatus Omnitrophota bacterium]